MVKSRERFAGYLGPEIVRLAPDDGVQRLYHSPDRLANEPPPFLTKLGPNPSHRSLLGLMSSLYPVLLVVGAG